MARLRPENYIHGPTSPANSSTSNQSDADTSSAAGVGIGRGPRNPMFNIYDTSGKRIRTKDASTADGQRCLDEYHRTHGFYPKTYPDGIFIASFNVIRREVAEAAQRRASAGLSGGRQFSQGQNNNNNIPTISSNPNTSITTMADNTSTSNSISPMEDQTQSNQLGGNEFSSDGESSGTEAAQVNQAVVKQANTNYIIPNFDADLPPIPDIQKSFYQLEQERLHGPIRPPYFPKNEWNKPIGAFVYATKENSDSEEDSDDENERLKGVKALAEKKALVGTYHTIYTTFY